MPTSSFVSASNTHSLEFNNPFAHIESLRKDKLTVGMQQSPLIEWEERIYGFRYINTVPWDFLGFSPALLGVSLSWADENSTASNTD